MLHITCTSPDLLLEVTEVSALPLDALNDDIVLAVKHKYQHIHSAPVTASIIGKERLPLRGDCGALWGTVETFADLFLYLKNEHV